MKETIKASVNSGLSELAIELNNTQVDRLVNYLLMLDKWNKVYNLTAVRNVDEMITHHLLDSLSVVLPFRRQLNISKMDDSASKKILDVGSGAGLPGVVLAICFPDVSVVCIDAVAKKMAFVRQVSSALALDNLVALHSRVESVKSQYSIITSRAFASLSDFVAVSANALADGGCWMAMKGKVPHQEIEQLPDNIDMFHVEQVSVPGLNAERCIVWMKKRRRNDLEV